MRYIWWWTLVGGLNLLHSSGLPDLSRGEERAGSPFMVWSPSCLSLAWRRGAEERSRGEESRREQRTAAAQTRVALHLITNKILWMPTNQINPTIEEESTKKNTEFMRRFSTVFTLISFFWSFWGDRGMVRVFSRVVSSSAWELQRPEGRTWGATRSAPWPQKFGESAAARRSGSLL